MSDALLATNNGILKNITIQYDSIDKSINNTLSLLVKENNGTIDNVDIYCEELNLACKKSQETNIYINAFATNNSGTINACELHLKSNIETSSTGECFVGGFVGNNTGKVSNCTLKEGSSISTTEADVTGICVSNETSGIIDNCTNYANISQTSTNNAWSPNVSGIVLTNLGKIESCFNSGNLSISSNNTEENAQGNIILGGISAVNYGSHLGCLNKGNISISSQKLIAYCGGISAYATYLTDEINELIPSIENCGTTGTINIQTTDENAYVFAGGICGYLYGKLSDSYSLSTFTTPYDETKYFFGTSIGSSYLQYQIFSNIICIEANNNHVLEDGNAEYHIGALINGANIVTVGVFIDTGITSHKTIDEIKSEEVYWNE